MTSYSYGLHSLKQSLASYRKVCWPLLWLFGLFNVGSKSAFYGSKDSSKKWTVLELAGQRFHSWPRIYRGRHKFHQRVSYLAKEVREKQWWTKTANKVSLTFKAVLQLTLFQTCAQRIKSWQSCFSKLTPEEFYSGWQPFWQTRREDS